MRVQFKSTMCGIAGIYNSDGKPVQSADLEAMTRALAHRGPDGAGVYVDGGLGIGHRSLTVLQAPANYQPMACVNGRYRVTFNGEIYNFRELRKELSAAGYTFQTDTDTEIIGAAYDRWGADCQLKFNGMWAFALWDSQSRVLFLSRDRFGVKPLFFLEQPHRLVFASEMKAFLKLEGFDFQESTPALRTVLSDVNALESGEETIVRGIKRLRAGHCLWLRDGKIEVRRWWNTLDHLVDPPRAFAEQVEMFRELFLDACRIRFQSAVPGAACISGGLDSTSVLFVLSRGTNGHGALRAYHAAFPDTGRDEVAHAQRAIESAGAVGNLYTPSAGSAADDLERIIYDVEDIWGTMPLPMWGFFRHLRQQGIVVAWGGDGADELLAGYPGYAEIALTGSGGPLRQPRRVMDLIATAAGLHPMPISRRLHLWLSSDSRLRSLWRRFRGPVPLPPGGTIDPAEEEAMKRLGPLSARLYRDFHYSSNLVNVRDFERSSMAHSVELRMPFMDWRLVCLSFSLPEESKLGGGFTKRILREAMKGIVPDSLRLRRSKIGFASPLEDWFGGPLRNWLWDVVNEPDFLQSDLWDGASVRSLVASHRAGKRWPGDGAHQIWPLLHVHLWRRAFSRRHHRAQAHGSLRPEVLTS
jgi:asparagine synthase (glutamine-hydrolysing)